MHIEITDEIPGVDLEVKHTIPVLEVIDDINTDKEIVPAAASNANIKRNNTQLSKNIRVDKEDQEPIIIPPIPPSFEVPTPI